MSGADLDDLTFTAPQQRIRYLGELCLRHLPEDRPQRVLDLGCGTGEQIFHLLERRPLAEFVGVDISDQSIRAATGMAAQRGEGRASFVTSDYLELDAPPFDLIVTDSVLQTIPADDRRLYAKLAGDLREGGRLLVSIPYDCLYNRVLWSVRRPARPLRGPALESLVLAAAKRLHPDWEPELLRERIPYFFMLPERFDGRAMRHALSETFGLRLIDAQDLPRESLAKAKHRCIVYRREPAPEERPGEAPDAAPEAP
jgi:SAM-dependent methyltransferase